MQLVISCRRRQHGLTHICWPVHISDIIYSKYKPSGGPGGLLHIRGEYICCNRISMLALCSFTLQVQLQSF